MAKAKSEAPFNRNVQRDGVAQDWAECVRLLRFAVEHKNADAQFCLGVCYANGEGVAQDKAEAVRLFRLAAEQKHADAHCRLGICYANAEGVAQDKAEAVRLFRLAAEQKHADAQCNLGICYERGDGVAQDWAEAVRLFRLAAEQKHADAQCNLGICYEMGDGVAQDWAEATRYFRLAASQGHVQATICLGTLLVTADSASGGEPTQQCEGALLLARAAQQHEDTARRNIALALLGAHAGMREVVNACCIGCGQTKKLKMCSKCRVAKFCGAECMQRMWSVHKAGCRRFAAEDAASASAVEAGSEACRAVG